MADILSHEAASDMRALGWSANQNKAYVFSSAYGDGYGDGYGTYGSIF